MLLERCERVTCFLVAEGERAMLNGYIKLIFVIFATSWPITDADIQCVLNQEMGTITVPFNIPSFLVDANKTQCQTHGGDQNMLRCGQTNVYIKPECVCSFFHVYEATYYHRYSFCPDGAASDKVTQLKCPDCKKYSLKNNGPCINGGTLICKGEEVAPEVTCKCPANYEGRLCEIKIENITRLCNRISEPPPYDLENCNTTWKECVTYSRNESYAFKCEETNFLQDTRGLPPCLDTENTLLDKDQGTNRGPSIFHSNKIIFYLFLILAVAAGTCTCLLQIKWRNKAGRNYLNKTGIHHQV